MTAWEIQVDFTFLHFGHYEDNNQRKKILYREHTDISVPISEINISTNYVL
jgi:hypothetical protein